jgi:hypothetical protein
MNLPSGEITPTNQWRVRFNSIVSRYYSQEPFFRWLDLEAEHFLAHVLAEHRYALEETADKVNSALVVVIAAFS